VGLQKSVELVARRKTEQFAHRGPGEVPDLEFLKRECFQRPARQIASIRRQVASESSSEI